MSSRLRQIALDLRNAHNVMSLGFVTLQRRAADYEVVFGRDGLNKLARQAKRQASTMKFTCKAKR